MEGFNLMSTMWRGIKFIGMAVLWGLAIAFFLFAFDIDIKVTWTRVVALMCIVMLIDYSLTRIVVNGINAREAQIAREERDQVAAEARAERDRARILFGA
jgi:phosphatidylserine synthase